MNPNSLVTALLTWSAVHFIADFAFQSAWMAIGKSPLTNDGKDDNPNEVLLYHCLTYTATFVVFAKAFGMSVNPLAYLVIFLAHVIVDWHKARKRYVTTIWLDQIMHLLTLVPLIWVGWLPP